MFPTMAKILLGDARQDFVSVTPDRKNLDEKES